MTNKFIEERFSKKKVGILLENTKPTTPSFVVPNIRIADPDRFDPDPTVEIQPRIESENSPVLFSSIQK